MSLKGNFKCFFFAHYSNRILGFIAATTFYWINQLISTSQEIYLFCNA